MTRADHDCSGAVRTRRPLVILLCAIAPGIVSMHGLGSGPASGEHVGHHATGMILTVDTSVDAAGSIGAAAGDEAPPVDDVGLLALCLMVLAPGVVLSLWMLATAARGGNWRLPRLARRVVALDAAGLPPRFERQLTVLRI